MSLASATTGGSEVFSVTAHMANTYSKSPTFVEDAIGPRNVSRRPPAQCPGLKLYGIFNEGICNVPDSELEMSDNSSNVAKLVHGLLLQRTSSAAAKIKDLEDMMPLEWCRKK